MNETTLHPARSMGFLSRLHDGELSASEKDEFLRHRDECAECAAAADEYEAVLTLYREAADTPADPRMSKRISAHLDARLEKPRHGRFLRLNVDLVLASVVVVCLVGALIAYSTVPQSSISIPRAARTLYVKIMGERQPPPAAKAPVVAAQRESRAKQLPARAPSPGASKPESASGEAPVVITAQTGVAAGELSSDGKAQGNAPAPARAPSREAVSVAGEAAPSAGAGDREELEKKSAPITPEFVAPTLLRRVEPSIPSSLKNLPLAANPVVLEAVIDESGDVTDLRIVRSNPLLDRRVMDAVRRWKYRPAHLAGRPVAVKLTVTLRIDGR